MARFRNSNGDVIETHDAATINDYRHRAEFEEIDDGAKKTAKKTAAPDQS